MQDKTYKKAMVETMMVETFNSSEARFNHLLSCDMSLEEVVTVSRAMKLLIDKSLEQSIQKIIDKQEPVPPTPTPPPTPDSLFDPSMN